MSLFGMIEKRGLPLYVSSAAGWYEELPGMFAKSVSGRAINRHTAVRMMAVFACQSLIADAIASLPVDLYRQSRTGEVTQINAQAPSWLKQPNPFQNSFNFWHLVIVCLLTDGNAFIATMRDDSGNVKALYVLDPRQVSILESADGNDTYSYLGEPFDRSQILHIPAFVMPPRHRGLSPIELAAEAIGLGLTAEEFGSRFFAQGTTMSGVIEHPNVPKPGEAALLKAMFKKNHAGVKNSHAVGVLTGGATFKTISVRPDQAQFLDTRKFQKGEIALLYRVPAYLIDPSVTSTWGSGIEEQNRWFVDQTLMPWIVRIEQAISSALLPGPQYIRFNADARMRGKTTDRYEAYKVAWQNSLMSADEIRALENLPPLPKGQNGDKFFRPANIVPIDTPITGDQPPLSGKGAIEGKLGGEPDGDESTAPKEEEPVSTTAPDPADATKSKGSKK